MDYRALFGIVVRAFGLVLIWDGFYEGLFATLEKAGIDRMAQFPATPHMFFAAAYFIAGGITLKAANLIVDLAYGSASK